MSGGQEYWAERYANEAAEEMDALIAKKASKNGVSVKLYNKLSNINLIFKEHRDSLPHGYVSKMDEILSSLLKE